MSNLTLVLLVFAVVFFIGLVFNTHQIDKLQHELLKTKRNLALLTAASHEQKGTEEALND